jgi:hypothetical protein
MFLPERSMSIGERMVTVAGSTVRLTTAEMMDYIDRVIALAGELGCHVMSPSEAGFIPNSAPPVTGYGMDAQHSIREQYGDLSGRGVVNVSRRYMRRAVAHHLHFL